MWRACSTPAPASNKFCIFTKVLHLSEVHRRSELSHLSKVRSRQSTTSHNIIRLLRSSQNFLPETEDEADGRYIALLCSYTFSVLLLHRCVWFVFPLSLYHSQRTSTPRVCMSISLGNRIDGIFLFCIETHRSVLFVVTPSSCCPYNVQSERLLQVSACAFLGIASTRMPTVHSTKFCFHIVAVCLWSRRPCHVHRERLPHMSVCVCTSWAKLDENADDIYFSSVFIHIVAYYRSVLFGVALSR